MSKCLGRLAPRHDPRTLRLARYLAPQALEQVPPRADWSPKVSTWGMMLNDRLGDCTCAAAGHAWQIWSANESGREDTITDADIERAYNAVNGGFDRGAVMLDVLNLWRRAGIGGRTIGGFAQIDTNDHATLRWSVWALGGSYVGVNLPQSTMNTDVWDVRPGDPVIGGHAIWVVGYDTAAATYRIVSWGKVYTATERFMSRYVEEAWAVLALSVWAADGQAPSGLDASALWNDIKAIGGDPGPEPPKPPDPPQPPDPPRPGPWSPDFGDLL